MPASHSITNVFSPKLPTLFFEFQTSFFEFQTLFFEFQTSLMSEPGRMSGELMS